MDNINEILNKNNIENEIKNILLNFEELNKDTKFKKGIYVYGSPGCGKTQFVKNIIKDLEYDRDLSIGKDHLLEFEQSKKCLGKERLLFEKSDTPRYPSINLLFMYSI